MASNNMSGIEKLKELADQIEREHESELQTLYERYKTDLREAREARDIAIKESAEYKHQLGDIIEYLGVASWEKPVLSSKDGYDRIISELDKRLMPFGMEWPRFEDGMQITWDDAPENIAAVCLALDGSCYSLHYDMPDDERMCIYEVSERVKRPGTEVLGADVLPIEVAHTQPDTQERIDDDATMPPRRYYAEKIGNDVDLKDDEEVFTAVALSLLRRQRELDAKTTGSE